MIENIIIKKIATYDDSGTKLNNLKKINFIYGANGSGKTTLSNFIADSRDIRYPNCSIAWKHEQPLKTLVYNKEFRDRNFGSGNINGVFTLGQSTEEDIQNITKKQEELTQIKNIGITKKDTLYWILRKKNKISTFKDYGIKNPIQTSYELLWQELKDKEANSNHEGHYNMMMGI